MNSGKLPYLLFVGLFASTVVLSGCRNIPPVDSSIDTETLETGSTDTDTETQKPSTDTETDTSTDTTQPKEDITLEEFVEQHPEIAGNFAEEMYSQISYIKDSLSTHYAFVEKDGKIEKVIVANVVKTGETERELKIATINILPSIEIEEIVQDKIEKYAVSIEKETVMSFDAKENYINDTTQDITLNIDKLISENLGKEYFTAQEYTQEEFVPQTVAELVKDYPEKVNEILNETCFEALINRCVTINYNPDNIVSAKWYLEGENEITGVGLLVHYKTKDNIMSYRYGKATPSNNVSIKNFIEKENIQIDELTNEYMFGYYEDIQNTRNDLVNAIFEANGMSKECPEGAIRLFKDDGYLLDINGLGETNGFEIVQLEKGKITSFYIMIKQSSNDEGYIQKLKNAQNYRINDEKVIVIDGEEIEFELIN